MTRADADARRAFELLPWLVNGTLDGSRARRRRAARARVHRVPARAQGAAAAACRRARPPNGRRLRRSWLRPARPRARRRGTRRADSGASRYAAAAPFAVAAAAGLRRARRPALVHAVAAARRQRLLDARDGAGRATPRCSTSCSRADATAAEMQALLDDIGGEIVAGPSELGRYSVRVAERRSDDARLRPSCSTRLPRIRACASPGRSLRGACSRETRVRRRPRGAARGLRARAACARSRRAPSRRPRGRFL